MRPLSGSPVPSNGPKPATNAASSNSAAMTPQITSNGLLVSLGQCKKCQLVHPASRKCPALASESQIRIALDDVKGLSGGDSTATQRNKVFLQSILKEKKASKLGANGMHFPQPQQPVQASQPAEQQISRQPVQQLAQQPAERPIQQNFQEPIQQPVQQPVQQPIQQRAQLSAPVESSESESGSESESETASETESGSSGSESGEDVLREILSR